MLSGHEGYIFFILLQLAKAKFFQVGIFYMDMKNVVEFRKDFFGCFNALETHSVQMIISQYLLTAVQQPLWPILEVRFV